MQQLKNYSDKLLEIELFKKNNSKTFNELEKLQSELEEAEKELKAISKETGKDIENEVVSVKVIESYTKFFDYETFFESATKLEKAALTKAGGIVTSQEINKDVFDECVKQGLISQHTRQMTYREELKGKSVRIINKLNK